MRYSYFEIWPWNIKVRGHGWGQRSRSLSSPIIQPMHLLFVSHQSDQPFLRYVQWSVWPWKNTSEICKEKLAIKVCNKIPPKSNQVISMARGIWLPSFVVIGCGFHFILQTSKSLFIIFTAVTLGQGHQKVIQYIIQTYTTFFVPNI